MGNPIPWIISVPRASRLRAWQYITPSAQTSSFLTVSNPYPSNDIHSRHLHHIMLHREASKTCNILSHNPHMHERRFLSHLRLVFHALSFVFVCADCLPLSTITINDSKEGSEHYDGLLYLAFASFGAMTSLHIKQAPSTSLSGLSAWERINTFMLRLIPMWQVDSHSDLFRMQSSVPCCIEFAGAFCKVTAFAKVTVGSSDHASEISFF